MLVNFQLDVAVGIANMCCMSNFGFKAQTVRLAEQTVVQFFVRNHACFWYTGYTEAVANKQSIRLLRGIGSKSECTNLSGSVFVIRYFTTNEIFKIYKYHIEESCWRSRADDYEFICVSLFVWVVWDYEFITDDVLDY